MKARSIVIGASVGLALLLVVATTSAQAGYYYYGPNPVFLPFAVAGAVVGTAAAIVTAPFTCAGYCGPGYYYGPPPPVAYRPAPVSYGPGPDPFGPTWIPGHYNRYGDWVPGHWRN